MSSSRLEEAAIAVRADGILELSSLASRELYRLGFQDRRSVLIRIVLMLVVILLRRVINRAGVLSACLVCKDRSVLCEVIVAIARRWLELGRHVTQRPAVPLVGVEVHLAVFVGIGRDVSLHGVVGIGQQASNLGLQARGIEYRNRHLAICVHLIIRRVDRDIAQRDKRCGDLHLHLVARGRIGRMRHRDNDVAQVVMIDTGINLALEFVGIY